MSEKDLDDEQLEYYKQEAEYWTKFSDECLESFEALAQTAEKGTTVNNGSPKYCFVQPIVKNCMMKTLPIS